MQDYITGNTVILGVIGFFAPFIIPFVFGFIEKVTKKVLTPVAKKVIVLIISGLTAMITVAVNFTWTGNFSEDIGKFILMFTVDGAVFLGMLNTVYTHIVQLFPEIDQRLESLAGISKAKIKREDQ